MIISFSHNFIYFRPKKTGSSTIVEVLRPNLGDGDISRGKDIPDHPEVHGRTHLTAEEIKKIVPAEFWDGAFKFASERHPYEKAVSLAYFQLGKQQRRRQKDQERAAIRFARVLERVVNEGEYQGYQYYTIDGLVVADAFIRLESFRADFALIAKQLGVAVPQELPRRKADYRLDNRPAREVLSGEQKRTVFEKCREEFELLGYER
jgi:hypothetical protein